MKIAAFIPVRGGSKGIPDKNIKPMAGRPLLHWTVLAALGAKSIDKVVVATDSPRIAEAAKELTEPALEIFFRDPANCTDTATTESAMLEYAGGGEDFTHMMLIQATSPLITSRHLDEAVETYLNASADSLIALVRQIKFIWEKRADGTVFPVNYDPLKRPMRQQLAGILTEPGAFYLTTRQRLISTGCRISGVIVGYELPEECYVDIDTPLDWAMVESILEDRSRVDPSQ